MTIEMRPMMRPRWFGATIVMTVVIMSGIMIAVPMACTTRPTMSISKTGESAAMSVPTLKVDMAMRKTGRVLRRCISHPVIGITTAIVNANAVVSHCPWVASMRSDSWIFGSATLIIVSLRKTTNTAASSRISARRLRDASAAPAASTVGVLCVWGIAVSLVIYILGVVVYEGDCMKSDLRRSARNSVVAGRPGDSRPL
jgi:hypothetical protein